MKISAGITAAPQDVSLPIFRSLKSKGYRSTRWHTNAGATDVPCLSKDGDVQDLTSFLFGLQHAAPIYEKTHVGCKCTIEVTAPGKPSVMVNAFGIVQGEGDIDTTPTDMANLPPEDAEAVAEDVEVAESNSKTPKKTADQWRKKAAPAPVPKAAEPKAKTEKKDAGSSKAVPVNQPGKATKAKVGQLVKKVLDVK